MVYENIMSQLVPVLRDVQFDPRITLGEIGTLLVLFATLIVGIMYACYTYKLWRETNFQSILSISPYIIFKIDDDDVLYVKNIGNSIAFNVTIDPFIFIFKDKRIKGREIYRLKFEPINLIETKEVVEVKHDTILPDGRDSGDFSLAHHLSPKYQKDNNYLFSISYTNIIGKKYVTKFYAGKDGIRIKQISRITFSTNFMRLVANIVKRIRMSVWF